jgi:signal transduction histidine kinase
VWLESCPTIGRDSQGVIVGILDIARDITARKAMEEALIEARKHAEVAAEAKSEFLANMSHELRTPLTTVIGFADALNDYCDLDSKAKHFTERVRNASRALLSTVNDILDYSKIERGLVEYEPEFFAARAHLEETLEIFAVQAKEKGLALRLECASVLDNAELFTDPFRLRQVLINLIGNAIKFTEEGSVSLRAGFSEGILIGEGRLRCEIIDTGPGIPADRVDQLFQRFSQVDKKTSRRYGGTGLGLAICKAVVCGMGGEIGVTTDEGKGSVFWFELPVQLRHETDAPRAASLFIVSSNLIKTT